MNQNASVRKETLIDSHAARKKEIGAQDMAQSMMQGMGGANEDVSDMMIKAKAKNMTLMEYRNWKRQAMAMQEFSQLKRGEAKKRKKGEINHFGNFPLNGVFSFGAKFIDMDDDFFPDLIISGDFGTSQMLWNQRNKTFYRGFFNVIEDLMDNSMGCTVGDWDQDGKQDIMFTSVSVSLSDMRSLSKVSPGAGLGLTFNGNHLYRNLGERRFDDKTDHAGVRLSGWGWGAFFFDFDNDGDLDVLNGNGMDDPETTDDDVFVNQKMRLYVNKGPAAEYRLVDEAEEHGIADQSDNRGSMSFDYDGDGDLDVFVVNHGEVPSLYRNDGGDYYDWLRVKVLEDSNGGHRHSIGARVYITPRDPTASANASDTAGSTFNGPETLVREVKSAAAFCGQNELTTHFGLGKAALSGDVVYKVRVVWPPIVPGRSIQQDGVRRVRKDDVVEAVLYNVPIRTTLVVRRPPPTRTEINRRKSVAIGGSTPSSSGSPGDYTQSGGRTLRNVVSNAGAVLPVCTHKMITSVSSPKHGQVVVGASGRFIKYRAFPHYAGKDSFNYTMDDGRGGTSTATVHINVAEPPSDAHKEAMRRAAKKSKFASFDGRGNNVESHAKEASTMHTLRRLVPAAYGGDGLEDAAGMDRASAREISNKLFAARAADAEEAGSNGGVTDGSNGADGDKQPLNDLHVHFGQFVSHDISFVSPLSDFTATGDLDIAVPKGDTTFDSDFTGEAVIRFRRTTVKEGTGREFGVAAEQVNQVTGWLDLSVIYGSTSDRAMALRNMKNGKIKMQRPVMPVEALAAKEEGSTSKTETTKTLPELAFNTEGIKNLNLLGKKADRLVVSGDTRVNMQPGLLAMHTIWTREHNRAVDALLEENPAMTDRDLFLRARKSTIATFQAITMYEWLPTVIGPGVARKYNLHSYTRAGG